MALNEENARLGNEPANPNEDEEPAVTITTRAVPLIELLEAALKDNVAVMWEEGGKLS